MENYFKTKKTISKWFVVIDLGKFCNQKFIVVFASFWRNKLNKTFSYVYKFDYIFYSRECKCQLISNVNIFKFRIWNSVLIFMHENAGYVI